MTDMQTSLPVLIVQPSILNPIMHFSTHLWLVKWNALQVIPLPCAFHFMSSNVDATQPLTYHKWYDSLHIIMWPYWFIDVDITFSSSSPLSIGAKSLLKFHHHVRSIALKPPTCPSHLQPVHQAKRCLDLLHLATWFDVMSHMQWAPSSHVWPSQQIQGIFVFMACVAHTSVPMD